MFRHIYKSQCHICVQEINKTDRSSTMQAPLYLWTSRCYTNVLLLLLLLYTIYPAKNETIYILQMAASTTSSKLITALQSAFSVLTLLSEQSEP